jgi:hypothetical protein
LWPRNLFSPEIFEIVLELSLSYRTILHHMKMGQFLKRFLNLSFKTFHLMKMTHLLLHEIHPAFNVFLFDKMLLVSVHEFWCYFYSFILVYMYMLTLLIHVNDLAA